MVLIFIRYCFISVFITFLSCSGEVCNCSLPLSKEEYEFNIEVLNNPDFLSYWNKFDELLLVSQKYECYRLSIVSPLDERIKIYRIQQTQDGFELHRKEYNYHPSNKVTIPVLNEVKNLSKEEWATFKENIKNNCFWTMPIEDDNSGLDGIVYRLEGFSPVGNICTTKKYHTVSRWSPDSTSFIKLCDAIINSVSESLQE